MMMQMKIIAMAAFSFMVGYGKGLRRGRVVVSLVTDGGEVDKGYG